MQGQKFIVLIALVMLSHSAALGQFLEIQRGNRAFNRGDYDEAKLYYDKVLTQKQKLEERKEALFNSASVDYKKKDYEGAIKQFESLAQNTDLSPELRADAHYNIGNALVRRAKDMPVEEQMKLYQQALNAYKQALALNPRDREAKENYEFVRSLLRREEERQRQREQNRRDKNQQDEKQQDQKNSDTQRDQNRQDQESEKNEKKDEKEKQKKSEQNPEPRENQNEPMPQNFSEEEAERILNALKENEKELLKKYQMKKSAGSAKPEKDW
ncbi:MAG: tetratricopeptide repeat protein [Candidatus Thermochlorobacter sp.]